MCLIFRSKTARSRDRCVFNSTRLLVCTTVQESAGWSTHRAARVMVGDFDTLATLVQAWCCLLGLCVALSYQMPVPLFHGCLCSFLSCDGPDNSLPIFCCLRETDP